MPDAMISGPNEFDVCRALRKEGKWMPVIVLTVQDAVEDRDRGLDVSAHDFLRKPFS